MLFVLFWVIGQVEEIVRGHQRETGQPDQHIRGNIPLAQLVVAADLHSTLHFAVLTNTAKCGKANIT